mmetsp:Transcript_22127/g.39244  ORF Transcript_22127/g.39244 Transcript_22127/m.39244 type:complete len:498 (-) Transcript_22127:199-1692(-)
MKAPWSWWCCSALCVTQSYTIKGSGLREGLSLLPQNELLEVEQPSNSVDPSLAQEKWYMNRVDHFTLDAKRYAQRYFIFDKFWGGPEYPIFFYTGNEADVTQYVNATGIMWENAEAFQACLIFAEHRYYGVSQPTPGNFSALTSDQALADFAELLGSFRTNHSAHSAPAIAFGGSYGGMLSAWFRHRYPTIVQGALAASAPIFAFQGDGMTFFDDGGNGYWQIVTRTAGASCASRVRPAFRHLLGGNETREEIAEQFGLCKAPESKLDVAVWVANAFDTLAMGDFPYKSNYLTGKSDVYLPPFPMKEACREVESDSPFGPLLQATSVFYNASKEVSCHTLPDIMEEGDDRFSGIWMQQWCGQAMPEELYFTMTGESDMFFPFNLPYNETQVVERCAKVYGIARDTFAVSNTYGDPKSFLDMSSNIIFSNGLLDPWSSGGVQHLSASQRRQELYVLPIPDGAHHADLFFSDPSGSFAEVRKHEMEIIRGWLDHLSSFQ